MKQDSQLDLDGKQPNTMRLRTNNLETIPDPNCTGFRFKMPRFLFRGFSPTSGGGFAGLNTDQAIIPHGFLDGTATRSISDVEDLQDMLDYHLQNDDTTSEGKPMNSCFSSWTPSLEVALSFAGQTENSRIAIVDTSLLDENIKVFHTADLCEAGLREMMYNDA